MKNKIRTYHIRTYGCQMNEYDSEIFACQLKERGLLPAAEEEADLIIYNTCSIRDLAERKVMSKLGLLSRNKKKPVIGIAGCMVMSKKEDLFKKIPYIDFLLGTNNLHELKTVIDELLEGKTQIAKISTSFKESLYDLPSLRENKIKAYVPVSRGCNNFCSYCVVPHTRGREFSRSFTSILDECKQLADQGYKEIFLLGQNVNSYGNDHPEWKKRFHDLLFAIDQIDGIERIRFMTSHPKDISHELIYAIKDLPKVCEFIHFPLQSGSDAILRKMNRKYTLDDYLQKVALIKKEIRPYALGTDIIVGFPTETKEDFQKTYEMMKEIEYSTSFLFAYSPRKNTAAYSWEETASKEEKKDRLQRLMLLQKQITQKQQQDLIGKTLQVLVEKEENGTLKGRSRCWRKVVFPGEPSLIGTLQDVQIHSTSHQTLFGKRI